MLANFEKRAYNGTERVWTGRYRNLHNLPHWHLENELICVEQGQATVSHNHQEYLLTKAMPSFLAVVKSTILKVIRIVSPPSHYLMPHSLQV